MAHPWLWLGNALLALPVAASQPAKLDWVDCWFEPAWGRELRCAHFRPSRTDPAAAETVLPVVVIPAAGADRRPSPILYLPGGPGMPAGLDTRGLKHWMNWAELARWPHDLVLFDPRGTGLSRPRLDCPEIRDRDRANLARPVSVTEDLHNMQQTAEACFNRLEAEGFRPEDYSTPRQVRDAIELMQVMGGREWNLYGISYGSRVALQILRESPGNIRSAVLDSAYPPEVNGTLNRPAQFARAWTGLLEGCAMDADCRAAYPGLDRQLPALYAKLSKDPVLLRVAHWPTDRVTPVMLNGNRFMWILFMESYRPRYRPRLVPAIAEAVDGDFGSWAPIAADFLEQWLDPDYSHAVYLSATCAEDFATLTERAYQSEVARYPIVTRHVEAEWRLNACHRWPVKPVPPDFRAPVKSSVPTLFLGGARDTATLPEWSRQAVQGFSRGTRVIFGHSSHGVSWENPCAMATAWEFLDNPAAPALPPCLTESEKRGAIRPGDAP